MEKPVELGELSNRLSRGFHSYVELEVSPKSCKLGELGGETEEFWLMMVIPAIFHISWLTMYVVKSQK